MDLGPAGAAMPGDRVEVTIELGRPVALDIGLGFAAGKAAGRSALARSSRCTTEVPWLRFPRGRFAREPQPPGAQGDPAQHGAAWKAVLPALP